LGGSDLGEGVRNSGSRCSISFWAILEVVELLMLILMEVKGDSRDSMSEGLKNWF
jgi:hypothetical protein